MRADRRRAASSGRPAALRAGFVLVGLWMVLGLAGPALAPYSPIRQIDPPAGRFLPPLSERTLLELRDGRILLAESTLSTSAGLRYERLGESFELGREELLDPTQADRPPRRLYLLGTDGFGRDLLSRLLDAARRSLLIGLLAVAMAVTLGVGVGSVAALAGGAIDAALMRLVDALLAFPRLFLLIALAAVFSAGEWIIVLVLGGTGWMGVSRLVRAELLSLREREFVLAAEAVGLSPVKIWRRHLLPNAMTPVIVVAALRVGDMLLIEAALSFVGLGVQTPAPSWGNLIAEGSQALPSAWWISVFPGLAIVLTVLSFHLLGDGLRDYLDPRGARR